MEGLDIIILSLGSQSFIFVTPAKNTPVVQEYFIRRLCYAVKYSPERDEYCAKNKNKHKYGNKELTDDGGGNGRNAVGDGKICI